MEWFFSFFRAKLYWKIMTGVCVAIIGYFSCYKDSIGNVIGSGVSALLWTMVVAVVFALSVVDVKKGVKLFIIVASSGGIASLVMVISDLIW